jgi:nucleoside-diphosphate-sugar epimerase
MKLAITGADCSMGAMLCRRLAGQHEVVPIGSADQAPEDVGPAYRSVDLKTPAETAAAILGVDMVIHAQPHDPACGLTGRLTDGSEAGLIEQVSRGTYVLMQAAKQAGIGRVVLISQLRLYDAVPEPYLVTAGWQPRPRAQAESLAPYMAELVCREIARVGHIEAVNLRMGELDAVEGTSADDAVSAVQQALLMDMSEMGYNWHEQHVATGGRFAAPGKS